MLTIGFSASLSAQEDKEMEVLIDKINLDNISISGFGDYNLEFSSLNGDFCLSTGGSGAILFNQKFYFGAYGIGLATSHYRYDLTTDYYGFYNPRIQFSHGGFMVGYIIKPYNAIHFTTSLKAGWGRIAISNGDMLSSQDYYGSRGIDKVFVLTPHIGAEMNVTHWFRVNAGAGYRLVTGVSNTHYESKDFSSPEFTLSFIFGSFKHSLKLNKLKNI